MFYLLCVLCIITAQCLGMNAYVTASKVISISNQTTELYLQLSTANDTTALYYPMTMVSDASQTVSPIFECYIDLDNTKTLSVSTSKNRDQGLVYGGSNGSLTKDDSNINTLIEGPVLLTVDFNQQTYSILPITEWNIVNNDNAEHILDYQGNNRWSSDINITHDNATFFFRANGNNSLDMKRIGDFGSQLVNFSLAEKNGVNVQDISIEEGTYSVTLDLNTRSYAVDCTDTLSQTIVFMGSSVCNGQGAFSNEGYAYRYNLLLEQRQKEEDGNLYDYRNISVGGNNTMRLMERWERDLIPLCGEYLVYGLSLGNEGIHENGQAAFDQFYINMQALIAEARNRGLKPVIMNNYTRGDFSPEDYAYIKAMNLLIHQWDVPSVNLLGAIDDGYGHWAATYIADTYHPNTEGHKEFLYAMVPSLFDALEQNKPMPQRISNTQFSFPKDKEVLLYPENVVHSFTHSFACKTAEVGVVSTLETSRGTGTISFNDDGHWVYRNPTGDIIESQETYDSSDWVRLTLSHYYAKGVTVFYVNDEEIGRIKEKNKVSSLSLNQNKEDDSVAFREWFFYRSGMNGEEIHALMQNKMLQSSLELYSPLDGLSDSPLYNCAQSTNGLKLSPIASVLAR
ncbi:MAG: SGNH/GDSL hydrolase family protein [Bacteroidales bacterium]|nr:SGNH/GDSL hydrolase family protein [Bacteroidales bacterium]